MTTNVGSDHGPVPGTPNDASVVTSSIASIVVAPPEVTAGEPPAPVGVVTLDAPAPAGGVTVELNSDHPGVAQVPASVELTEGRHTRFFDVAVTPVEQPATIVITARRDGTAQATTLVVHPPATATADSPTTQSQEASVLDAAAGALAPQPQIPASNGVPDMSAHRSAAARVGVAESAASPPDSTPVSAPATPVLAVPSAASSPAPRAVSKVAGAPSFAGALLLVTPWLPIIATITSVLIYASPESPRLITLLPFIKQNPVLVGFVVAVLVALVAAVILHRVTGSTSAKLANATEYAQLVLRIGALDARLAVLHSMSPLSDSQRIALSQADTFRQQIDDRLSAGGVDWVAATGYVGLWGLVHATEENLLLVDPVDDVIRSAIHDDMRIQGSALANGSDLQAKLRLAVVRLQPDAAAFFTQPPGAAPAPVQAPSGADARSVVSEVRQNINGFRDDNRDAMVRSRGHLQGTVTLTGLATYLALALALNGRTTDAPVDPLTDSILAASTFFLVGAIIGLFNRLSNEATNDSSIEDYGLSAARMRLTPVLSGLAALAGVVVVAMLPAVLNNSVFTLVSTTPGSTTVPMLFQVYSLSGNPIGIIFAAIFGLTPALPLGALQAAGEKYRANLKSTMAAPAS